MSKIITIRRGDEHRAKIERSFCKNEIKNDIFEDVYFRAGTLVKEITDELRQYDDETDKKYLLRYQGMGNNIIIFCGERGQGKTSAMQSFAKYLTAANSKKCGAESGANVFLQRDDKNVYEVIDTIDPSAMENGESVLRVLISRLFFQLEKSFKDINRFSECDNDLLQEKESIVKLFEKCYQNIDYIKSGRCSEYEQDDLETLSQLGSSAKLKTNLHDLIEKYLKMISGSDGDGKEKRRYLVIPIDDADLATKKVFRLCEDIRNYLSIPNVIILMAVDYEQLVQATYQRYLKQYTVMWKAERKSEHESYVVEECHEMAAKYLEKVFPITHRIDLPQIDYMLMEGYEDVEFRYIVPDDKEKGTTKFAFEGLYPEECKNLQDQLLEILYKRTGLVFVEQDRKMHLFLPHTLRELSHWVKMLYDMHEIDCDDIYQKYQDSDGDVSDLKESIANLKDNILMVKKYFMNYWCEKYLDTSAIKVFQKVDNATRRKQMAEVKNILYGYLQRDAVGKTGTSYQDIVHGIVEEEFEGKIHFQEAMYIYYTIFLNEWFAVAMEDSSQFNLIISFIERIIDLSKYSSKQYMDKYNILKFEINVDILRAMLANNTGQATDSTLRSFCVAVKNNKIKESINITDAVNQKICLGSENDFWEVDVLRPVIASLKYFAGSSKDMPSHGETKMEFLENAYLITIRNVMANCDVQRRIRDIVDSWYEMIADKQEFVPLSEQIPNLYKTIEDGMGRPRSRQDKELVKIYENASACNKKVVDILFMCNDENLKNYLGYLNGILKEVVTSITTIKKNINSDENKREGYFANVNALQAQIENGLSQIIIEYEELEKAFKNYNATADIWRKIENSYRTIKKEKNHWEKALKLGIETQEKQEVSTDDVLPSNDQDKSLEEKGKDADAAKIWREQKPITKNKADDK